MNNFEWADSVSYGYRKVGFHDCHQHGSASGAELFIVEGESASKSVCAIRDSQFQAVLPMQGKPINAHRASANAIRNNDLLSRLQKTLGFDKTLGAKDAEIDVGDCRFERVILLFDPDADGVHCGALMLMYFYSQLRSLLEHGLIYLVRAPVVEISYLDGYQVPHSQMPTKPAHAPRQRAFAYLVEDASPIIAELKLAGKQDIQRVHYRGLGNIPKEILQQQCINPASRNLQPLTLVDAEAAIAIFGRENRG